MKHPRWIVVLAILGVFLLFPRRAWSLPETTWLVAIGDNLGDAADTPLLYAERDARELTEVIRRYGGVAPEHVRVLIDEDAGAVRRILLEANAALRAASGPTALVVYYSGHADAESPHLHHTRLPLDELRGLVQGSPATLRLLMVDACRSGTVTRVKGVTPAPSFAIKLDDRLDAEGMAILSSSAAGEPSHETDRLRGSFFTHHLINALRGAADRDGDGRVTLAEAHAYTYAQTVRSSGETLSLQHPTYAYDVKGRGDVVLTSPGAIGRRSSRLRLASPAVYVVSEEREGGPVVAEVASSTDRALLALPEGRYFVQQREPDELREYTVDLRADQEVELAGVPSRRLRYDQLVRKGGGAHTSVHGFVLMGGGHGALLAGEGALASVLVGYNADFPALSLGARLRYGTTQMASVDSGLASRHHEIGLAGVVQHYIDLRLLSLSFGASIEGVHHLQHFAESTRTVSDRETTGAGFGAFLAAELGIQDGFAFRLEGGPIALVVPEATLVDGVETGHDLRSLLTWSVAAGLAWRL